MTQGEGSNKEHSRNKPQKKNSMSGGGKNCPTTFNRGKEEFADKLKRLLSKLQKHQLKAKNAKIR